MPGEQAEQWRGEGHCQRIPLDDLVMVLPQYTTASMLSSRRIEKENPDVLNEVRSGVRAVVQLQQGARRGVEWVTHVI